MSGLHNLKPDNRVVNAFERAGWTNESDKKYKVDNNNDKVYNLFL